MPATPGKQTVSPQFEQVEIQTIPTWARTEYRNKHTQLSQAIYSIVRLERNIANMEMMLDQDQIPKALRVNTRISVHHEQQAAMNLALQHAKKTFEKSILQALIDARKAELRSKKATADKTKDKFLAFVSNGLDTLQRNDISPLNNEDDSRTTLSRCSHNFQMRAEKLTHTIRIQETFKEQKEKERRQRLEAMQRENQINEELTDPHTRIISRRITHLEQQLKSINRGKPALNRHPKRQTRDPQKHRRGNTRISKKGETPSPFAKGSLNHTHVRRPTKRSVHADIRPTAKHNRQKHRTRDTPDRDIGNQKPRRPSTNIIPQSGSTPKRSRKRQN